MKNKDRSHFYPEFEERLNVLSHGIGLILSVIGFILLINKAIQTGNYLITVSFTVFGLSMILLYAASTFYHNEKKEERRYKLNILDHASIYVLIAGTYTPFAIITLEGTLGWIIFGTVWTMACAGIILKLFFTGRFQLISTLMYVVMGWIIITAIKPLINALEPAGLWWLFAGGISYTLGAVLFMFERIPYNHAIFHLFVLVGTFCHFITIYNYVIPTVYY